MNKLPADLVRLFCLTLKAKAAYAIIQKQPACNDRYLAQIKPLFRLYSYNREANCHYWTSPDGLHDRDSYEEGLGRQLIVRGEIKYRYGYYNGKLTYCYRSVRRNGEYYYHGICFDAGIGRAGLYHIGAEIAHIDFKSYSLPAANTAYRLLQQVEGQASALYSSAC